MNAPWAALAIAFDPTAGPAASDSASVSGRRIVPVLC